MNTLKLMALATFAVLLSCCKATQPTAPSGPAPSLIEVVNILDSARTIFIDAAETSGGNPHRAIQLCAGRLSKLNGVRLVYPVDSTYIHIILNSGLKTGLWLDEIDSAGHSIFRGGSTLEEKATPIFKDLKPPSILSKNTINNKKVLFFAAANNFLGLQDQLDIGVSRISNSGLGLEVTVLRDQECMYDVVETFKNYGLVILDTHGNSEGFLTGNSVNFGTTKRTEEELRIIVDAQLRDGAYDKIVDGELELIFRVEEYSDDPNWLKKYTKDGPLIVPILVNSKYLQHLPDMPNTVIVGNMCFSGWINTSLHLPREEYKETDGTTTIVDEKTIEIEPIGKAFIDKKPISYYGYTLDDPSGTSRTVKNGFAKSMEELFLKRLVTDRDSTGIANRADGNNIELFEASSPKRPGDLYFRHYGATNYSYFRCGDSFTDDRDGQKYKAVCIGKQTWMAQNLNYNAPGSICYDDNITKCDTFGRLYDRKTVMQGAEGSNASPSGVRGVCPNGWHLPSYDEFTTMINALGGERIAGEAMKSLKTWVDVGSYPGTNSSGFNGLAAGIGLLNSKGEHEYQWTGIRTYFWNTVPQDISTKSYAPIYVLDFNAKDILKYSASDEYFISCRCVKDK